MAGTAEHGGSPEHAEGLQDTGRSGDGDLLTHHGADEDLLRVHRPGQPDTRMPLHPRRHCRFCRQCAVDGCRVRVKVEQPADTGQQDGQILQVLHPHRNVQSAASPRGPEPAFTAGKANEPGIPAFVCPLDPVDCARGQEGKNAVVVRFPQRQRQAE